jgi:L-arabinokinase
MKTEQISGAEIKPFEVLEFESMLRYEDLHMYGDYGFEKSGEVVITRAPAQMDVMGGTVDYFGASVLGCTLGRGAVIGCQARADRQLRVYSFEMAMEGNSPGVVSSIDEFYMNGELQSYEQIRQSLTANSRRAWAAHVLGVFFALLKEKVVNQLPHGAAIVIKSNIPIGAGVGASVAIQTATLTAANYLYRLNLTAPEVASIARIVAEKIIRTPQCSVNAFAAAMGRRDEALLVVSQPERKFEAIGLPPHTKIIGIYSKVKLEALNSAYGDARTTALMGLAILRKELELAESVDLRRLSLEDFRRRCRPVLPVRMRGEQFLDLYGDAADTVAQVEPKKVYHIRSRVEHVVHEQARVQRFIECLKNASADVENCREHLTNAGKLMYASNWSYRFRAGLGAPEIDQLVRSMRKIGRRGGFYGAKITDGGRGGTIAVLCHGEVSNSLVQIFAAYKLAWGLDGEALPGSSPGAAEFGPVLLKLIKE